MEGNIENVISSVAGKNAEFEGAIDFNFHSILNGDSNDTSINEAVEKAVFWKENEIVEFRKCTPCSE